MQSRCAMTGPKRVEQFLLRVQATALVQQFLLSNTLEMATSFRDAYASWQKRGVKKANVAVPFRTHARKSSSATNEALIVSLANL